ncbi:MAG: hypothetical protein K1X57_12070 [Gemmataceae bacterium]|nr:hypothetical protein [Gemmataceae bacterium]
MPRHRLAREADHYRLPAPPAPVVTPGAFASCPTGVLAGCTPEQINGMARLYQEAFDRAVAALTPESSAADILFSNWN